jgi:ankyrin repeat protein
MPADASELMRLMRAIAEGDTAPVSKMLAAAPSLARQPLNVGASRQEATDFFFDDIKHYVYGGDTALHVAAASYQVDIAHALVSAGADVTARNRRGAQPLHYAADSFPGDSHWHPQAQTATIAYLVAAGADPNATDKSGVAPLHRAVRTRGAASVRALLDAGADPRRPNKSGSTPMKLATRNTGRGGAGTPEALAEQAEIIRMLEVHGAEATR